EFLEDLLGGLGLGRVGLGQRAAAQVRQRGGGEVAVGDLEGGVGGLAGGDDGGAQGAAGGVLAKDAGIDVEEFHGAGSCLDGAAGGKRWSPRQGHPAPLHPWDKPDLI